MKFRILALSAGMAGLVAGAHAQAALFNALNLGNTYFTAVPNEMGEYCQMAGTGPQTISGVDAEVYFPTVATSYTDLLLNIQFYAVGPTSYTDSSSPAFTTLLSSQTANFGAFTSTINEAIDFNVTLGSNVTTTNSEVAVLFTFLNGAGVAATGVTILADSGSAATVGSNAELDYNLMFGFAGGTGAVVPTQAQYLYSGATPDNMAIELISSTPEPCSMAILGLGAVGLIARRRRSKSA